MMEEFSQFIGLLAIAIAALSLIALFYHMLTSGQKAAALRQELLAAKDEYSAILETNKGLSLGAVSLNERLARIEQEFSRLHEDVDRMSLTEQDSRAFTQAIKLAGRGANVDELVETCDLSKGEAELIVLLHSQRTESADDLHGREQTAS